MSIAGSLRAYARSVRAVDVDDTAEEKVYNVIIK